MQELSDQQLFAALQYARSQDEQAGRAILERFQSRQPVFAQTILRVFPSVMVDLDQAMAHLFMDLCFDVIAVYEHTFGKVPDHRLVGNRWFEERAERLDREMKMAMKQANPSHPDKAFDQERQTELVGFLHAAIDQQPCSSTDTVRLAKTMIFTTVQMFDALYDAAGSRQNSSVH
ncbi:hypothetical protein JWZ98_14085 [Methylomonas sp. EFPC1]|uniref:hypothetical protein n=1 Tax=Methylomonas sp. EFPC1 TaxID=2812647 RepID=UPI001966EAEA|nr:hypothetical protein [Methylomonas sp. EFPC1]QSA99813.1 hypothetical protein JWZ98_14085 [Methylomonas sp. EFPC1]